MTDQQTKQIVTVPVGDCKPRATHASYQNPYEYHKKQYLSPGGPLDYIFEKTKKFKETYSKDYANLQFTAQSDCGCRHDCSCSPSYMLMGDRLENDLEYNNRLQKAAKAKETQDARNLAEYERLKKALGK